jgi:hypothetical protein
MKDDKVKGVTSTSRREMIKLGVITGGVGLAALGGVSEALARETLATTPDQSEDRPIIVGGGARWIEVELPFPFSVKSEEEGVYSIYKATGRPRLSKIVITDNNDHELFSWPIAGDWKVKFV